VIEVARFGSGRLISYWPASDRHTRLRTRHFLRQPIGLNRKLIGVIGLVEQP
jgi:hypothetical protein